MKCYRNNKREIDGALIHPSPLRQADERKMEEMTRLKREHEDCLAEMYNFMTSDLLTENPDVSQSNLGPNRRIGYLYKGMTEEEKKQVREYQLAQIEEAKV